MKKVYILFLISFIFIVSGCSNTKDLTNYDKIELTTDNIYDYIDVVRLSGSFDGKTAYLKYVFESEDEKYVFEDVSFDTKIIECYNYNILFGTEVSDNIYIEQNKVELDSKGNSADITVTQSVNNKINSLCSAASELFTVSNLKGYVYIPWD